MNLQKISLDAALPQSVIQTQTAGKIDYETLKARIAGGTRAAIIPVCGDCLEGGGVENGGWIAVDFTRFPARPEYRETGGILKQDLCLCYATFTGERAPEVMSKVYCGVWGPWQMVGTCYDLAAGRHQMNCVMAAQEIFGVIFASWGRDGALKWKRDPESFPITLGTTSTIRGVNCGIPVRKGGPTGELQHAGI